MDNTQETLIEPTTLQWLEGNWKLVLDPQNSGRLAGWGSALPDGGVEDTPVPGIIQQVFPAYQGVAWYYHRFTSRLPLRPGFRYAIGFGAVDYLADVWLNGSYLGRHEGGETPFQFDVSDWLKFEGENLLAVRVLCPCNDPIDGFVLGQVPHRNRADYRNYSNGSGMNMGGILYPVSLQAEPVVRVADLFVRGDIHNGLATIEVTVESALQDQTRCSLRLAVCPAASGQACTAALSQEIACPPGASLHAFRLSIPQPRLWQLEDPYLYRLDAELSPVDGIHPAHRSSVRFGLREFKVKDGFFHLNGKRLFLRSTHTGNHYPVGSAFCARPRSHAPGHALRQGRRV